VRKLYTRGHTQRRVSWSQESPPEITVCMPLSQMLHAVSKTAASSDSCAEQQVPWVFVISQISLTARGMTSLQGCATQIEGLISRTRESTPRLQHVCRQVRRYTLCSKQRHHQRVAQNSKFLEFSSYLRPRWLLEVWRHFRDVLHRLKDLSQQPDG
jgi:hypothetical protein